MGVKFERKIINVNVGDFSCQNEGNFKISKARPAIQAGEMGAGWFNSLTFCSRKSFSFFEKVVIARHIHNNIHTYVQKCTCNTILNYMSLRLHGEM